MKNRFEIPCEGGVTLVVERNPNPRYDREVYIFLMDTKTGDVTQELAIVRQAFKNRPVHCLDDYEDAKWIDKFEVLVYGGEQDDDYTDKFVINRRKYEEEE